MLKQNAVRSKNAKLKCREFSTLQKHEIKMQRKLKCFTVDGCVECISCWERRVASWVTVAMSDQAAMLQQLAVCIAVRLLRCVCQMLTSTSSQRQLKSCCVWGVFVSIWMCMCCFSLWNDYYVTKLLLCCFSLWTDYVTKLLLSEFESALNDDSPQNLLKSTTVSDVTSQW